MSKFPFQFRDLELQEILEMEVMLPKHLTEQDFANNIQHNNKIFWMVNHRWLTKKVLALLLDDDVFKTWRRLKQLHWIIVLGIIAFALWKGKPEILCFFLIYPILTVSFSHSLFLVIIGSLVGLTWLLNIHIPFLWFFVSTLILGYVLNKSTAEMAERNIIPKALKDWPTFWRYYSNQIIKIKPSFRNNERYHLMKKFPELNLNEKG